MNIILYSNNCPRCKILEQKMQEKHIEYNKIEDEEIFRQKQFSFMPMLEIENKLLSFKEAFNYINSL